MRSFCAAVVVFASIGPRRPANAFDSFAAATILNNAAGATIVSDILARPSAATK
jgi:hypothetical protein